MKNEYRVGVRGRHAPDHDVKYQAFAPHVADNPAQAAKKRMYQLSPVVRDKITHLLVVDQYFINAWTFEVASSWSLVQV